MRILYLMRHALAEEGKGIPDLERHLSLHGAADARNMARHLLDARISPQLILSSPAKRAFETAAIISEEIIGSKKGIQIENGIYRNDPDELLDIIRQQPDKLESLMIVGHNPSISQLALSLSRQMNEAMPPAAIAAFYFPDDNWTKLSLRQALLSFYEKPG